MHAFLLLWSGLLLCLWNRFYNVYKSYEKLHIDVLTIRGAAQNAETQISFCSVWRLVFTQASNSSFSIVCHGMCVIPNSLQSDLTRLRYQRRQLITCMQCVVYIQPLALILRIAIIIIAACRYDNECLHFGLIKHLKPSLFLAFFCQFSLSISSFLTFLFTISLSLNLGLPWLRLPSFSWE